MKNLDVKHRNAADLLQLLKDTPCNSLLPPPVPAGDNFCYPGLKQRKAGIILPEEIEPTPSKYQEIDYLPTRFIFLNSKFNWLV